MQQIMEFATRSFSARSVVEDGKSVVMLNGELDLDAAPKLTEALVPVIEDGGDDLVIDLSELTFIDSSGLATFIAARRRASERGRRLIIRSPRGATVRLLELTGLMEYLNVEADGSA